MPALVSAAILGVVQGLTEFLPISSTAHLLIGERLLGYQDPGGAFTVMIQLGSILAVMWLYRSKIIEVLTGLASRPEARRFALLIVVATVPALVAGALFSSYVKTILYQSFTVIGMTFILGGIVMLIVEWAQPAALITDPERLSVPRALVVGVCQMVALVPGVSRSGATIVGGMLAGLERRAAAEFSFFVAMPTMAAAFADGLLDARHYLAASRALEIGVGFVMAFIASVLVVKPFLGIVSRSGFKPFAWYRIAAGIALLAAVWW